MLTRTPSEWESVEVSVQHFIIVKNNYTFNYQNPVYDT